MQVEVGQIVEGKVTGITKYGAFVDLGENTTGMVHISEVAHSYVTDIHEFVKENDTVKMKVLSVGEDGKISLSIKRAQENPNTGHFERSDRVNHADRGDRPPRRPYSATHQPTKIDPAATWTTRKQEPSSFEDMMNRFKQTSDEKFSDLKRKNADTRRPKRTTGAK